MKSFKQMRFYALDNEKSFIRVSEAQEKRQKLSLIS